MHCIEWEWHKSLLVKAKSIRNTQITQNSEKCEKYIELWWTFDVQAIYDNIKLKYECLNSFGTSWLQELPVDHMIVH